MHLSIRNLLIYSYALLGAASANAASFAPYFDLSVLGDMYAVSSQNDLNNGQLHGRFKLISQKENLDIYFDLGAGGLVGKKAESYFILPQAYIKYQLNDAVSVTLGRIRKTYSHMDDYWMLGDVQPLFRWDAVRPETQGLPGIFFDYKMNKNFEINVMGSYLFLPSQGPSFSIVGGKLTSGNPWFSNVVDVLALSSGASFDLLYSVKTPDVKDVIFKPSIGISTTLKTENEGLWLRLGYFLKHRNELALPFEGVLLANNTGNISVEPRVAEHKITTVDLGAKTESTAVTLSAIYESDVEFELDPAWIYPQFSDQYKVAANILYQVTPFHSLELGGIKTYNNNVQVFGLVGVSNLDIYSFRNQYENAADIRITSVFMPQEHGFLFKTKARFAYDYEAETSLLSFDIVYTPFADVSFFARSDLFGGERKTTEAYNNMLVNYLDNDRFQAGVKYVF